MATAAPGPARAAAQIRFSDGSGRGGEPRVGEVYGSGRGTL